MDTSYGMGVGLVAGLTIKEMWKTQQQVQ